MLGFVVVQSVREMRSGERIDPWGNPSEPLHLCTGLFGSYKPRSINP